MGPEGNRRVGTVRLRPAAQGRRHERLLVGRQSTRPPLRRADELAAGLPQAGRHMGACPSARRIRDQAGYRQYGRVRARRDDGTSHRGEAPAKPIGRNPPMASVPGLAIAAPPAPADIGDRKQLFIDGRFIADRDRVELRANPPEKLGLVRDEKGLPLRGHIARVIDDAGKVRLYLGHEDVQVLESDDGLHFRRNGVKLPGGTFPMIFLDPHETDPARRYKLFHLEFAEPFDPARHGATPATPRRSDVHKVGRVFPFFTDNPTIVHWDGRIQKYVIYTRASTTARRTSGESAGSRQTTRSSRGPIRGRPRIGCSRRSRTSRSCTRRIATTTRTRTCTTTRPGPTRGPRTST